MWFRRFLAIIFAAASVTVLHGQVDDEPIRVKTVLANLPVIVSDRMGKHVPGLQAKDFKITSGGNPQEIVYFSDAEVPLHVAIVLDVTGSVKSVLGGIKKAAREFVDQLGPDDRCMVVTFGEEIIVRQPFTGDKTELHKRISGIDGIRGGTGLMNEAIFQVIGHEFEGIKGRKAIILLTDAGEIDQAYKKRMLDDLIEADVVVYPIYYPTPQWFLAGNKNLTLGDLIRNTEVGTLSKMADYTAGRLLLANGNDFGPQFQQVMDELKKMYVLGVYPEESPEGRQSEIRIGTVRPDLVIRSKSLIRPKRLLAPAPPK